MCVCVCEKGLNFIYACLPYSQNITFTNSLYSEAVAARVYGVEWQLGEFLNIPVVVGGSGNGNTNIYCFR